MSSLIQGLEEPAMVVVTGASGGVGGAVVRACLDDPSVGRVVAVSRGAETDTGLAALARLHTERLHRFNADLTDAKAIEALGQRIAATVPRLHLLFNAAGVLHATDLTPEKSLDQVDAVSLQRSFALNAHAPILLAKALLPLVCQGQPVVLATVSARVGSIGDNRLGGWYAYRAAKAAQNQLWRTLSLELRRRNRNAVCVSLHPGTVRTALSEPFRARVPSASLLDPDQSAAHLLRIIGELGPADSGRFIAWDGDPVPW